MNQSNSLGQQNEDLALTYLRQQGLTLIQRNYRSRLGEIDLVMKDIEHVVFVEVRYRSSTKFGGALASVDRRKQSKLIKCAQQYMTNASNQQDFRYDVNAISPSSGQHEIQWITNAFDEF